MARLFCGQPVFWPACSVAGLYFSHPVLWPALLWPACSVPSLYCGQPALFPACPVCPLTVYWHRHLDVSIGAKPLPLIAFLTACLVDIFQGSPPVHNSPRSDSQTDDLEERLPPKTLEDRARRWWRVLSVLCVGEGVLRGVIGRMPWSGPPPSTTTQHHPAPPDHHHLQAPRLAPAQVRAAPGSLC